ncbi:MAG: hypothetical protein LBG07_02200 [Treponema sp.]|jgi:hypothetical protein|nr:hypothetical protein [Treponema sp.]
MNEGKIILHVSENGDDSNEGSSEKPLWSVAAALDKVRWKSYRAATFVIHGSVTEVAAHNAMIDITGRGLPVISLRGESPENPGRLNAAGLNKRVLYISDGNTLYLEDNLTLCGGLVHNSGGSGVTLENATLIMQGGEISGNDSGFGMGGGVYAGKGSEFIMEGGLITGNTTIMHGGGVFPDEGGTFTMNGGIISGNTAYLCGGGVFVGLGSEFEMTGGCIKENKTGIKGAMLLGGAALSPGRGGGVFISKGTCFRMRGGEIAGNRAIAVQENDSGAGSGGGVFVEKGGVFYLEKGTIIKNGVMNWGGGVYVEGSFISLRSCIISNNISRLGGGGVHISGEQASFTMKNGCLLNNYTAGNGGGINIIAQGSFTMEGGLIAENEAHKLGNALAVDGAAVIQGGVLLSAGGRSGDAGETRESSAVPPDKDAAGIFIDDTGKLTLRGGEVEGRIIMKNKNQFEDLRETGQTAPRETGQGEI